MEFLRSFLSSHFVGKLSVAFAKCQLFSQALLEKAIFFNVLVYELRAVLNSFFS